VVVELAAAELPDGVQREHPSASAERFDDGGLHESGDGGGVQQHDWWRSRTTSGDHVGLAEAGSDGDRLQHLRAVLPCGVRVIAVTHPLFGQVLEASGFKRLSGVLYLVVGLPDGTPGTIPAAATNVFGEATVAAGSTVMSVEGLRRLRMVVEAMVSSQRRLGR
jgi:hypothetical protein